MQYSYYFLKNFGHSQKKVFLSKFTDVLRSFIASIFFPKTYDFGFLQIFSALSGLVIALVLNPLPFKGRVRVGMGFSCCKP